MVVKNIDEENAVEVIAPDGSKVGAESSEGNDPSALLSSSAAKKVEQIKESSSSKHDRYSAPSVDSDDDELLISYASFGADAIIERKFKHSKSEEEASIENSDNDEIVVEERRQDDQIVREETEQDDRIYLFESRDDSFDVDERVDEHDIRFIVSVSREEDAPRSFICKACSFELRDAVVDLRDLKWKDSSSNVMSGSELVSGNESVGSDRLSLKGVFRCELGALSEDESMFAPSDEECDSLLGKEVTLEQGGMSGSLPKEVDRKRGERNGDTRPQHSNDAASLLCRESSMSTIGANVGGRNAFNHEPYTPLLELELGPSDEYTDFATENKERLVLRHGAPRLPPKSLDCSAPAENLNGNLSGSVELKCSTSSSSESSPPPRNLALPHDDIVDRSQVKTRVEAHEETLFEVEEQDIFEKESQTSADANQGALGNSNRKPDPDSEEQSMDGAHLAEIAGEVEPSAKSKNFVPFGDEVVTGNETKFVKTYKGSAQEDHEKESSTESIEILQDKTQDEQVDSKAEIHQSHNEQSSLVPRCTDPPVETSGGPTTDPTQISDTTIIQPKIFGNLDEDGALSSSSSGGGSSKHEMPVSEIEEDKEYDDDETENEGDKDEEDAEEGSQALHQRNEMPDSEPRPNKPFVPERIFCGHSLAKSDSGDFFDKPEVDHSAKRCASTLSPQSVDFARFSKGVTLEVDDERAPCEVKEDDSVDESNLTRQESDFIAREDSVPDVHREPKFISCGGFLSVETADSDFTHEQDFSFELAPSVDTDLLQYGISRDDLSFISEEVMNALRAHKAIPRCRWENTKIPVSARSAFQQQSHPNPLRDIQTTTALIEVPYEDTCWHPEANVPSECKKQLRLHEAAMRSSRAVLFREKESVLYSLVSDLFFLDSNRYRVKVSTKDQKTSKHPLRKVKSPLGYYSAKKFGRKSDVVEAMLDLCFAGASTGELVLFGDGLLSMTNDQRRGAAHSKRDGTKTREKVPTDEKMKDDGIEVPLERFSVSSDRSTVPEITSLLPATGKQTDLAPDTAKEPSSSRETQKTNVHVTRSLVDRDALGEEKTIGFVGNNEANDMTYKVPSQVLRILILAMRNTNRSLSMPDPSKVFRGQLWRNNSREVAWAIFLGKHRDQSGLLRINETSAQKPMDDGQPEIRASKELYKEPFDGDDSIADINLGHAAGNATYEVVVPSCPIIEQEDSDGQDYIANEELLNDGAKEAIKSADLTETDSWKLEQNQRKQGSSLELHKVAPDESAKAGLTGIEPLSIRDGTGPCRLTMKDEVPIDEVKNKPAQSKGCISFESGIYSDESEGTPFDKLATEGVGFVFGLQCCAFQPSVFEKDTAENCSSTGGLYSHSKPPKPSSKKNLGKRSIGSVCCFRPKANILSESDSRKKLRRSSSRAIGRRRKEPAVKPEVLRDLHSLGLNLSHRVMKNRIIKTPEVTREVGTDVERENETRTVEKVEDNKSGSRDKIQDAVAGAKESASETAETERVGMGETEDAKNNTSETFSVVDEESTSNGAIGAVDNVSEDCTLTKVDEDPEEEDDGAGDDVEEALTKEDAQHEAADTREHVNDEAVCAKVDHMINFKRIFVCFDLNDEIYRSIGDKISELPLIPASVELLPLYPVVAVMVYEYFIAVSNQVNVQVVEGDGAMKKCDEVKRIQLQTNEEGEQVLMDNQNMEESLSEKKAEEGHIAAELFGERSYVWSGLNSTDSWSSAETQSAEKEADQDVATNFEPIQTNVRNKKAEEEGNQDLVMQLNEAAAAARKRAEEEEAKVRIELEAKKKAEDEEHTRHITALMSLLRSGSKEEAAEAARMMAVAEAKKKAREEFAAALEAARAEAREAAIIKAYELVEAQRNIREEASAEDQTVDEVLEEQAEKVKTEEAVAENDFAMKDEKRPETRAAYFQKGGDNSLSSYARRQSERIELHSDTIAYGKITTYLDLKDEVYHNLRGVPQEGTSLIPASIEHSRHFPQMAAVVSAYLKDASEYSASAADQTPEVVPMYAPSSCAFRPCVVETSHVVLDESEEAIEMCLY